MSNMYWIYLLPSTPQKIGSNGFFTTTCFDSQESSSGYVQNLLVWAVLLLRVLEVVGRYEVVAVLTLIWTKFWKHISRVVAMNRLIFQYRVSSTYDTHLVHSRLLLIIYACGTCSNVARHNIPEVYALLTRTLNCYVMYLPNNWIQEHWFLCLPWRHCNDRGAIPRIIGKFGCPWGEQGRCLSGHCRNSGKLSGQGIAKRCSWVILKNYMRSRRQRLLEKELVCGLWGRCVLRHWAVTSNNNLIHSFISIQPLGRFGRNQSPVRRPVWLWYTAY
jgi:hypothetical protein